MLEALDPQGRLVLAWMARRREEYKCPECRDRVYLKQPTADIIHHFAHPPYSTCAYRSRAYSGETTEHRIAKTLIYEYLKARGFDVEMEQRVYHEAGDQRRWRKPDVLLRSTTPHTAIEVQNSPLDEVAFRDRCRFYRDAGLRARWVFPFSSSHFDSLTKVGGAACCRPAEEHLVAFNPKEQVGLGTQLPYLIDVAAGLLLPVEMRKLKRHQLDAYWGSDRGYKRVGARRTKVCLPPPKAFMLVGRPINLNVNELTNGLIKWLETLKKRPLDSVGSDTSGASQRLEFELWVWRCIRKGIVPTPHNFLRVMRQSGPAPTGYAPMWQKPVEKPMDRWTNRRPQERSNRYGDAPPPYRDRDELPSDIASDLEIAAMFL